MEIRKLQGFVDKIQSQLSASNVDGTVEDVQVNFFHGTIKVLFEIHFGAFNSLKLRPRSRLTKRHSEILKRKWIGRVSSRTNWLS